jgi:hypothetical protein
LHLIQDTLRKGIDHLYTSALCVASHTGQSASRYWPFIYVCSLRCISYRTLCVKALTIYIRLLFALHLTQDTLHKGIDHLGTAAPLFLVIFILSLHCTSQGKRSAFFITKNNLKSESGKCTIKRRCQLLMQNYVVSELGQLTLWITGRKTLILDKRNTRRKTRSSAILPNKILIWISLGPNPARPGYKRESNGLNQVTARNNESVLDK